MQKIAKNINLKYLLISYLCINIFSINLYKVQAQIFEGGQNPPGIKWRQINTENFQILYPDSIETEAQRIANSLDYMIQKISHSLNKKPRRISIILQNQTVESNGFVQLAPRRSEFYAIPGQEFDYQDWLNSLAVHELRHVVQVDKISGNLRAPLFETLAFTIFGVTLPAWFFEGDAVVTETTLTTAGRGRQPSWEMPFRANLLSGREFNYSKNFLGSFKDRTPGYYQLGYTMMTKLRRDHGPMILDTLLRDMSKNLIRPMNLSRSSKKFTGLSTLEWHDATITELQKLWQEQLYKTPTQLYPGINFRKNTIPEDYLLPHRIDDREIIALKRSKIHTPEIVLVDMNGNEKKIIGIGIQQEAHLSYAAGKVVWDELRVDLRYSKRSFNVICLYDLNTNSYRQITYHSRLFSPALSPDGKKIAAIQVDYSNRMMLVELDANSGKIIAKYLNADTGILQTPKYNSSGDKIVYLRVNQQGKAIEEINLITKKTSTRLPYQAQLLARPAYVGDNIIFKAHYSGIDNIYQIDQFGQISQITTANFGAFYPQFDPLRKELLISNYQVNGYDLCIIKQSDLDNIPLTDIKNHFIDYSKPLIDKEVSPIDFSKVPQKQLPYKPYSAFKSLLNFHSLVPTLGSSNFSDDWNVGLQAVSSNLLNTMSLNAGYIYYSGLGRSGYKVGLAYRALYPIISLRYSNIPRRLSVENNGVPVLFNWREQETEVNIDVPFRFNYRNQFGRMGMEFSTSYTSRYDMIAQPSNYSINQNIAFPMHYGFYYAQNNLSSARDLAPRWGHNYRIDYRHFPFENQISGQLLSIKTLFFAPGLFRNHSLSASVNYQRASGNYQYTNDIPTISGYNQLSTNPEILKNTILLDYKFPFAYPDWELGALAYVKRLKAGFFADYENITDLKTALPRTYGFELSADLNLLRFYLPTFQAGGKIIFTNDNLNRKPIFEFGLTYSY